MKNFEIRRAIALLLCIAILLCLTPAAWAEEFTYDEDDNLEELYIEEDEQETYIEPVWVQQQYHFCT